MFIVLCHKVIALMFRIVPNCDSEIIGASGGLLKPAAYFTQAAQQICHYHAGFVIYFQSRLVNLKTFSFNK